MHAQPPARPVDPIVEFVRQWSGRPNVGVRMLTPAKASEMNVPNALVDPRLKNGVIVGPSNVMYIPQSLGQAFESLVKPNGVNWPDDTTATAIMTLLHESRHLHGGKRWQNEFQAQRYAIGNFMKAAMGLGIEYGKARRMLKHVKQYTRSLPRDYRHGQHTNTRLG